MKLQGKVAIVTGSGGGGIGRTTAELFAKEGAAVVINDVNEKGATEAVNALRAGGARAISVIADATNEPQVQAAVAAALREFGQIDILINNATGGGSLGGMGKYFHQTSVAELRDAVNGALFSAVIWSRAVINHMISRRYGKIVNTSSFVARTGQFQGSGYSMGKAALDGFTASLAKEVGQYGINVNCIMPGLAPSPGLVNRLDQMPERKKMLLGWTHFGRLGKLEEFARVHLFLASDDSSWISGATIPVEGGILKTGTM